MSDLIFQVQGESASATKFIAKARQFKLVIDEPKSLGGTDENANPVEYILAGLAGCLNVVSHLVANEMGFSIKRLQIGVSGNINPDKFIGNSTEERAGFKSIDIKLIPEADVSIGTLSEWLKIVQTRCPVKDNLTYKTPVKDSVEKQYVN
ncbi:MAG: OsmC family protein [Xanthomarina gelatinilytica]|uniref:OsmC family protein n=1 Tax=Xanthomarina gelatinilytica TaxID=1137281 RepID=UPI003A84C144